MICYRFGVLVNIKAVLLTLLQKKKLDKLGVLYFLSSKKRNYDIKNLATHLDKRLSVIKYIEDINKSCIVELTPYGVYGRFAIPNKITVNIQRPLNEIVKTILHELVHLELEGKIKSFSFFQREKIVDKKVKKILKGVKSIESK